ncbi:hypothetical protein LTR99_003160 [Exophiala xenobiotica]|uniref:NAD(P)-binding protein n=1 Tax=Vermiconidia calcicola TaxID=1690605 RepID=A0AAV9QAX9_9PEZI|nr:hypothetical protein LTR96_006773 [Exophiala xenobiotica]KAK5535514.1 hypothetical protein LTR23_008394 [Chaetothyriales sp. CCFEE 6169]KAK5538826.1 hypothetical protein LTR25_004370 [Vermiconidia calcicola]KAK5305616.1 hypothetical protein LTR99_003160 [Exophiala xenobiotica]KAK5335961.1 hypothetical protein LTR98_008177 [Exophiala xenobiotica]
MAAITDRSDPSLTYTLPFQLTHKIYRDVYDKISPQNPDNSVKGKIILITGGGTGIGAAAAKVWLEAGAEGVVITGRRKNVLDETAAAFGAAKSKVLTVAADISHDVDTDKMYKETIARFGRVPDVVLANAGWVSPALPPAEEKAATWWSVYEVNVLGLHNTVRSYINSQPDPKKPTGTVINVNTGLAGVTVPGNSAYGTAKLAAHKYMEFIHLEYPTMRSFTLLPGVVSTALTAQNTEFLPFAKDKAEQTGGLALYLAQERADYLKGSLTSINWDIEEMEAHKKEIEEDKVLQTKWIPILPCNGGSGF